MPRKATAAYTDAPAEPRRSSRIKEQPKPEAAPKKATKPRAKRTDKEKQEVEKAEDKEKEDKPKPTKGRKRKAAEEPNGVQADAEAEAKGAEGEEPAAKKACLSKPVNRLLTIHGTMYRPNQHRKLKKLRRSRLQRPLVNPLQK